MNTINKDFTPEDTLIGLYKLASISFARDLNIDLIKLEEFSSEKLELSTLITFARLGAATEDELEFVKVCEEALEPNTNTSETKGG